MLLPTTALAFSLPIMGNLQENLNIYIPISVAIILGGFGLYQRYADAGQPPPRPKVMIVRRKWAVGRTYQFPAINTAATVVNASRKSATSS